MLDYFFYYKNIGRFILYLKQSSEFFYFTNILQFNKLAIFFDVNNISDLSSISILSHIFFFKYYFGVFPFFTNYVYKFKLNTHYYKFFIQCNFFKKKIYYSLYFFFNDVYYMVSKANLSLSKEQSSWNFCVSDMNFFIEKKNTLGFFYLKHKLNFSFFSAKVEKLFIGNLFYLFKYKA
jgi:hypothetical protein